MWDPHRAFIGHHYFHRFKKNVLVKENVCKQNTSFFTKAISLHKKFKGLFMDNYFTTLSYVPHMGPS